MDVALKVLFQLKVNLNRNESEGKHGTLVSGHLGEGLLQLLGDPLQLLLLPHQLVLQPVHLGIYKYKY